MNGLLLRPKDEQRAIVKFNSSMKDVAAMKFFGKPYKELSLDKQMEIDDLNREAGQ